MIIRGVVIPDASQRPRCGWPGFAATPFAAAFVGWIFITSDRTAAISKNEACVCAATDVLLQLHDYAAAVEPVTIDVVQCPAVQCALDTQVGKEA